MLPDARRTLLALSLSGLLALPAAPQGFVERAVERGLVHEFATGFDRVGDTDLFDWLQRGMALGDIDGDGDVDVVACGGVLRNHIFLNEGGTFVDGTEAAGIELGEIDTAPALFDYDLDGDLDLFLAVCAEGGLGGPSEGRSRLYENDGTGAFHEVTTLASTIGSGHSTYAQAVDLDYDGLPDLLVSEFFTTRNHFYRNNGDGTFSDLSEEVGLDLGGSTHVTGILDVDGDSLLDVIVGNDYIVGQWPGLPNNLGDMHAAGQPDGTWLNVSFGSDFYVERGIMGYALGDVDYDGDLDVYRTDIDANHMVINQGWPTGLPWLAEEQAYYGVEAAEVPWPEDPSGVGKGVGWGAAFLDVNLDLWLDLFLVNGQVAGFHATNQFSPRRQPNFLWTGDGPGAGFTFTEETATYGLFDEIDDRTLAVGDMDGDGDLDLLVGATAGSLRYFENNVERAGQGWLIVEPVCRTSAPGGAGVLARFTDSLGYPHVRQIGLDGSTASQHERIAHFGLGSEPLVDLEVEFPSGVVLSFPGTAPNQRVQAVEPKLIETSAHTLPIAQTAGKPGNLSVPSGTEVDGLYAVTVFAHAQDGTALDETALVTIDTPGLAPLTDVLALGGNLFRRYYLKPLAPGAFRSTVTIDGFEVRIRPRVQFFDPADASGTVVAAHPESVRAGSGDPFEILVAPKDQFGVSLGAGHEVQVLLGNLPPTDGVADLGDGRYRASFTAPGVQGEVPIKVAVNGVGLVTGQTFRIAGPATLEGTVLETFSPPPHQAAAPHQLKLLVKPGDQDGLPLGPYAELEVELLPDKGTAAVSVRDDLYAFGQRDGEYMVVIEKPNTEPPSVASGVLIVRVDGVEVGQKGYEF